MAENQVKNIEMIVDDGILTITVDLKQDFGRSKSGKTIIIASTGSGVKVPGNPDITVGVNVYKR